MSRFGPIKLPPSRIDLAIGRACRRAANAPEERSLQVVTWLADEKFVLTAAAAIWLASRYGSTRSLREEADRMVVSVLIAGALPHVIKLFVRRRRPDRSLVRGRRNGVPRSGDAWDSFPSGHALHVAAVAPSIARMSPLWTKPLVWSGSAALAASRVMLLAHYASDVFAGWTVGVLINRAVAAFTRR